MLNHVKSQCLPLLMQGSAPVCELSWGSHNSKFAWVYGRYTELLHGGYKPTFTSLGGHHLVGLNHHQQATTMFVCVISGNMEVSIAISWI
jgi:hypothetical protein